MALYRTPAVVLRIYPYQETHYLVTLLSPSTGKIRCIAKGCRRLHSSLGRVVQPLIYGVFQLAEGKNLDSITQGVVKHAFPKIRSQLALLTHALYALELVDRLIEEEEPQAPLFFSFFKTLEGLEGGESPQPLIRVFEAQLLKFLGYPPQLDSCVHCDKSVELSQFSNRLGGVLCNHCHEKDKQAHPIAPDTLEAMRTLFTSIHGKAPPIAEHLIQTIAGIFRRFIEEKTGKTMHGFQLLDQIGMS